jgi:hypothetical protein
MFLGQRFTSTAKWELRKVNGCQGRSQTRERMIFWSRLEIAKIAGTAKIEEHDQNFIRMTGVQFPILAMLAILAIFEIIEC